MRSRPRPTLPLVVLLLCGGCAGTDFMTAEPVPTRTAEAGRVSPTREPTPPATRVQSGGGPSVEDRLEQMNQRLNQVDERVEGLAGSVGNAQKRADEASKKAETVDGRLTRLWKNRFNQATASSLEVYFSPDSIELTDAAQTALISVAKEMEEHPTLTVELGGYTDRRGALDYNYGLSQRRVNAVRRFLMDRGINLARIHAASLGPATEANISEAKKRRVTIRLMVDQD